MSYEAAISKAYTAAKHDGRLCSRCGWIVTKKDWKKGHRLCGGCRSALKGVNCRGGHWPNIQERQDKTGEMP